MLRISALRRLRQGDYPSPAALMGTPGLVHWQCPLTFLQRLQGQRGGFGFSVNVAYQIENGSHLAI